MQKPTSIEASFLRVNHRLDISLSILLFEEEGIHYVYSPALDLTGYDSNEEGALKAFKVVLEEFVNYTEKKKTVYKELERLGWTVNIKKKRVQPPLESEMLDDNQTYRDLVGLPHVQSSTTNFALQLS